MVPINLQMIEKKVYRYDGALEVVEIWKTIQGEGPFAGHPSIFIRLAGCNLQCPLCDTDYTSTRTLMGMRDIVQRVVELDQGGDHDLVVITGGEPFRQNLQPLINKLIRNSYQVQIETNGTIGDPKLDDLLSLDYQDYTVVCSPKTGRIAEAVRPQIKALKYVLRAGEVDPVDGLPTSVLGNGVAPARPWEGYTGPIYLQPCDEGDEEKNAANVKVVIESCMTFGYVLCLQVHKIVGLP
jgi:7-carboxy-7-deazaguanine synthase